MKLIFLQFLQEFLFLLQFVIFTNKISFTIFIFYKHFFYFLQTFFKKFYKLFSGIIIDTFGTLRDSLDVYNKDLKSLCYICGHDSETIEKNSEGSKGFKYHIKVNNKLFDKFNYILFRMIIICGIIYSI